MTLSNPSSEHRASDVVNGETRARAAGTIVIEPPRGWRALDLAELWQYRELFWVLTERDIKVRYKQTVLGFAWAIIQPVMMMVVFSVFFGRLAKMPADGLPYPIFVYAGLLPWTFFANTIATSANSLVASSKLGEQGLFSAPGDSAVVRGKRPGRFRHSACILLAMMAWYGIGWTVSLFLAPLLIAGMIFIALGVGVVLAALNVAYRDFRYVFRSWSSLAVCDPGRLSGEHRSGAVALGAVPQPMAGFIEGFRSAFLGQPFDGTAVAVSLAARSSSFSSGIAYFERVERRFADII